jgi:hypothetical protein
MPFMNFKQANIFNYLTTLLKMAKNKKLNITDLFKKGEDVIGYFDLKRRAIEEGFSEVAFHNARIAGLREQVISERPDSAGYIISRIID